MLDKSPLFYFQKPIFMFEKLIFALTAVLGFITLFIIGFRFKTNRHINFYLILFFFLGNLHFLIHSLSDVFPLLQYQKLVDLLLYINIWPLFYLYFNNLVNDHKILKIKELTHIIIPTLVFLFFFSQKEYILNHDLLIVAKIVFISAIVWNTVYLYASYKLLKEKVWKRNSDILIINQQNKIIKQWTQLLFTLFALMFLRFLVSILFVKEGQWYTVQNNFLWVASLIWIGMYLKILYSPDFLYGYEAFQNKIKEYKKHNIIFNNIWIMEPTKAVTNLQDTVLKKKIKLSNRKLYNWNRIQSGQYEFIFH